MKNQGVWGQLALIIVSPIMSLGALTMSILILFKDRIKMSFDVSPYQVNILSACAFFSLVFAIVEFYFAIYFLADWSFLDLDPSALDKFLGFHFNINNLVSIQVRGWIAAACFELFSVILYAADALMTRKYIAEVATDQKTQYQANQQLESQNPAQNQCAPAGQCAPNQFPAQQFAPNSYQGQQNPAMQYSPQVQYPMGNQNLQAGQYPSQQYPLMNQYPPATQYAPNASTVNQGLPVPAPPSQVAPTDKA
ncbi:hypothetical protein L596_028834 [Steinernema carpocapsae]|uniref:Uncharacterized protein n=1 Tax=Steinernema carpocapsae TaxID=34508 RepID=A0A4U5LZK9_STECR|nr:hypothetical protein L596_028834 [Steinernema carpocapsae]